MKEIIIRAMEEKDIDQALKLWIDSFQAGFSKNFDSKEIILRYLKRNPGFSTIACEQTGKLIGALLCGHDGRRGSIYHTAVHPDFRHKGIGKLMEERALRELSAIGIHSGFLFINVGNPGSESFWKSIGWTVIDDVKYLYKEF